MKNAEWDIAKIPFHSFMEHVFTKIVHVHDHMINTGCTMKPLARDSIKPFKAEIIILYRHVGHSDWFVDFHSISRHATEFYDRRYQRSTWSHVATRMQMSADKHLKKSLPVCFLAHLSRRLEWAIAVRFRPSSVVRKLFTFSSSSWKRMVGF